MKYLLISIIIIALFLPFSVSAGFLSGPIVPCGRQGQDPCTLCHIFELAKNVIQFLFEFILVITPIFVLIGGIMILISAGVPDRVAFGKRIITSAIIGVLIALLAWTILGMVFNALVGGEGFPWPWNEFQCVIEEEEEPPVGDRCNQMSSAGPCLSNNYYCQGGVRDQESSASSELRSLLNCMAGRLPSSDDVREISSISDNSGGRCFDNWDGQCSANVDSCTGTCCGHSQNSLHYGGRNCRGTSYAIDFANEQFANYIRNAAHNCATDLHLGDIDVVNEGNHIHTELDGLARQRGCL